MKYLILSDIHANWDALQAVLAVTEGTYDLILCCGDLVGYGPEPNRVVSWARKHVHAVVRGNHDRVCSGLDDAWAFNSTARESARWTKRRLTTPNKNWLKELKEGPVDLEACTLVHGSPLDEDEYVKSADDASYCRANLTKTVTFFAIPTTNACFSGEIWKRRRICCGALRPGPRLISSPGWFT
jgi:Icc-related predicted phosphoesterase